MKTYRKFFQQLLLLYRPFENRLNTRLAKHDLYRAQWSTLYYLFNNGSATLVELSNYQYVEKPTVTRTIHRLEELGYVEHVPGKDRREKRMQLTELGKNIYKDVRVTIDQFEQDILKGISEEEQLEAIRIMTEIRNNIIE
ncbi:MarR family winged helix-turn-helix transcriptional regulator [Domibacillus aminovorans]|uniref:MarR family transcriptional regulator n=1 Tax=Domibacillus aminovorans TaxID=29332 RepID=A0A177L6V2_9BACI|nr:MarR family transcriptional regulator [Domibacillus aminovorans]OAH61303.1 MarR family transcriptional regulator [Domibacillus aminovorans]